MAKNYTLGIAPVGGGLSVSDNLRMIADIGWDGFFVDWYAPMTEEWANVAAKEGLFFQSIHSPFSGDYKVSRMWREGEEGVRVTNGLIACVEDCARFDIPIMVIHPFIGFTEHTPTQIGLDNYRRVVEAAVKHGVTLGFENVEGEEYLAAIMKEFWNVPQCAFCFDTGHEQCYNEGKDMLALYGDKLCHTHFNDNLGVYDPNLTWENDLHLMMGDGIVDFAGVMSRIEKTPFEGLLNCELTLNSKPGRNDHEKYKAMGLENFYATALQRMRKIIGK